MTGLLAVGAALTLAFLAWAGDGARQEARAAGARAVRVAELTGTIRHLDEWLTMAARMMAATGERRWVERYEDGEPALDAAIKEAIAIAPAGAGERFASSTDAANLQLVALERRALDLAAAGELRAASAIMDGADYAALKLAYIQGLHDFILELEHEAAARAATLDRRAWRDGAILALLGMVMLLAFALVGRTRLRTALSSAAHAARTDPLTGLANRRGFVEALAAALSGNGRDGATVAVILIDLDHFKAVNDAHGHAAGDALLAAAAQRIGNELREGAVLARLGGDEFAIALPLGPVGPIAASAQTQAVADRLIAALRAPFRLGPALEAQVGASIGFAFSPGDATESAALLHAADMAMYDAKTSGRSCAVRFEPALDRRARERAELEASLRQALAQGAIEAHFQPIVSVGGTQRVVGFEALARWTHPVHGPIPPSQFIPLATGAGLMPQLTETMLRQACRAACTWPAPTSVAVNIPPSLAQNPRLVSIVRDVLEETGLAPGRLELELTEDARLSDLGSARDVLGALAALGVRISLDDFGIGYSDLKRIGALKVDCVKIDQSFIRAMAEDPESRKIVAAVLGLGSSMGLVTLAEGVEDEDTALMLKDMGCDLAQGWLFGRAGSAAAALALARETASVSAGN